MVIRLLIGPNLPPSFVIVPSTNNTVLQQISTLSTFTGGQAAGGDEEVVNWPDPLYVPGLFDIFNSVELHGTHFRGFVLLAVRTAKYYHLAAHVGYELSGEMPETAKVCRG